MKTLFKFYFPLLLICTLSLISCQTIEELDIPISKPKVTLASLLTSSGGPKVRLTFSKHILDENPKYEPITDAQVTMESGNESFVLEYQKETGTYESHEHIIQPGKTYRVMANVPEYETIQATDSVPETVRLKDASHGGEKSSGYESFSVTFDDPKGENYYEITGYIKYIDSDNKDAIFFFALKQKNLAYSQKNIFGENDLDLVPTVLIEDKLFDGQEVTIEMLGDSHHHLRKPEIYLVLRSVSKSYFKHNLAFARQLYNYDDIMTTIQPGPVYGNVQNGLGILMASSSDTVRVK